MGLFEVECSLMCGHKQKLQGLKVLPRRTQASIRDSIEYAKSFLTAGFEKHCEIVAGSALLLASSFFEVCAIDLNQRSTLYPASVFRGEELRFDNSDVGWEV